MHARNWRIGETHGNAGGRMAVHNGIYIFTHFENLGIDDRFARNGADAGELLERKVKVDEPIFIALLGPAEQLYGDALVLWEPYADVTPNVADLPLQNFASDSEFCFGQFLKFLPGGAEQCLRSFDGSALADVQSKDSLHWFSGFKSVCDEINYLPNCFLDDFARCYDAAFRCAAKLVGFSFVATFVR